MDWLRCFSGPKLYHVYPDGNEGVKLNSLTVSAHININSKAHKIYYKYPNKSLLHID